MLFSNDEKIERLEKRIDKLEKLVDRRFRQVEESFKLFRDVIVKLQSEKESLRKERDSVIEKQKELLKKIPVSESLRERIAGPVRNEIRENARLIRKMAEEDVKLGRRDHHGR